MQVRGSPRADLISPGHPLLDAVVDLTVERHHATLKHGAVLVDPSDHGEVPRLLVALTEQITDGHRPARTVSKRFDFVEITPNGDARVGGPAPYLDYQAPSAEDEPVLASVVDDPWLADGAEDVAVGWAVEDSLPDHLREVAARVEPQARRMREQVRQRLTSEINYWDARPAELLDQEAAGRELKIRPETAHRRARDLEARLEKRLADLAADVMLSAHPPTIAGAALVVPQGLLDRLHGRRSEHQATYARDTATVERRAVKATLAAERTLGREPEEMPHNHPGYDIRSAAPEGDVIRVEVKGRLAGADDFTITRNEVLTAKNLGDDYRLALVEVSPGSPALDQVRYVTRPFDDTGTDDFRVTKFVLNWRELWSEGGEPR